MLPRQPRHKERWDQVAELLQDGKLAAGWLHAGLPFWLFLTNTRVARSQPLRHQESVPLWDGCG
jgi:hypothetical protein